MENLLIKISNIMNYRYKFLKDLHSQAHIVLDQVLSQCKISSVFVSSLNNHCQCIDVQVHR